MSDEIKFPLEERNKIIKELANGKGGKALREELVDLINSSVSVSTIPAEAFDSNDKLAAETRGMMKARILLQNLYNKLIPEEEIKPSKKIHK